MKKEKEPLLGDRRNFGCQIQVYTLRGWVICDNEKEVEEELDKIESLKEKGK